MNEREFRAMTAIKLDGEMLSAEIKEGLRERIAALAEKGVTPGLGTLLVGDDGPSANYVAMKHRDSEELGMGSREVHLPADASQEEVDAVVDDFNADPAVDAYIMQYPFPDHLDYETACCGCCRRRMPTGCTLSIWGGWCRGWTLHWPAPLGASS